MKRVTTTTPMLPSPYKNDSLIRWMMSHISNDKYIHQNEKAFKEEITEMFVFNVWTYSSYLHSPPRPQKCDFEICISSEFLI